MNARRHLTAISKDFWVVSILILVCFSIYANSIQNDFVWDDRTLFVSNYDQWQWHNIKALLLRPDNLFGANDNRFYRPLPNITFLIDRSLWGRNASGYHLFNILFHTLSTITVYYIARNLFGGFYPGAATALLFAVHPIHTEVVTWINGRNNTISGFFYLLTFYYYIRFRRKKTKSALVVSLIAFLCSLLSKEYALTLPLIILLYEISYGENRLKTGAFLSRMTMLCLPYFLIIILFLFVRSLALPSLGSVPMYMEMLPLRILTVPKIVLRYLRLLLLPYDLTVFHDVQFTNSPWRAIFIFQLLALAAIIYGWMQSYRKPVPIFFGMGWFLVTLTPVLNIIPLSNTTTFFAERYLYIPCFGFCLSVVSLSMIVLKLDDRPSKSRMLVAALLLLAAIEIYGFETVKRNLIWRNEVTLWEDASIKSPNSFIVRTNFALAQFEKGNVDAAHKEINEAIRLFPHHDTPHFISAVILYHKGSFDEAEKALEKTLQLNPRHSDAKQLLSKIRN